MPAMIFVKCPYCKTVLPETTDTINIGNPFRDCHECQRTFIDKKLMEWDNTSILWKIKLFLGSIYGIGFYGIGFTLLPILLISYLIDFKLSNEVKLLIIAIGVSATAFMYLAQTPQQIRESKKRTSDPEYRKRLIGAGFKFKN